MCVLVCLFDTTAHTFFLAAPSGQPLSDMCGKPRIKNVDKPMAEFWASTKHGGNPCNVWHAPQPVDTQDAMCGIAPQLVDTEGNRWPQVETLNFRLHFC